MKRFYFLCLFFSSILLVFNAQDGKANEDYSFIEDALLDFHNDFLLGFDYQKKIRFPRTPEYYVAMSNLVVAVGSDIAIVLTAGKSEIVVKKVELSTKTAGYSMAAAKMLTSEDPIQVAASKAIEELINQGIKDITTSNVSVPGLRSGLAVYSFGKAIIDHDKLINEGIQEQLELLELTNDVAPAIEEIINLISKIHSPSKINEYLLVLDQMFNKKAELSLYRKMQFERRQKDIDNIEGLIMREIDYNLAINYAEGSLTPSLHRSVFFTARDYARGNTSRTNLDFSISNYIEHNVPWGYTTSDKNRIYNSVQRQLRPLERARREINAYGGSLKHADKRLFSYQELLDMINIDITDLDSPLIGFLIDTSGSMNWTDPRNIRHSALKMIIDRLQGHERVFIVDFDHNAVFVNPDHYAGWSRDRLKYYVDRLGASGGTNIGLGMDRMREVLEPHLTQDAKAAVLLFTDGMGAFDNNDQWFAQNNIPVYTVGYQAEADAALMQRIAANTNGVFLLAQNEQEIANTFIQFLNAMLEYNMFINIRSFITQDEVLSYPFYVDYNTTILNGSNSWLGSKIEMELIDPDGRIYRENGMGEWFVGKNYTNFNLQNPRAGEWTARLTGTNIPGQNEPFTFQVSGDTPLKFTLNNTVADNGMIHLTLTGEGNIPPLETLPVQVTLLTPENNRIDVSNRFANGEMRYYPMAGEGSYMFELTFDTNAPGVGRIQRHLVSTAYLGEYEPAYISSIQHIRGNYLTTDIGRHQGNRPGIRVQVFRQGGDLQNPIARGYVTVVHADRCEIEIQHSTARPQLGDIIMLDATQWTMDTP